MNKYRDDWSVAELCEPYDRDYAAWTRYTQMEREYERKHPTVTNEIEMVKSEICDNYCKYLEEYLSRYEDPDVAHDTMLDEQCVCCPLQRL